MANSTGIGPMPKELRNSPVVVQDTALIMLRNRLSSLVNALHMTLHSASSKLMAIEPLMEYIPSGVEGLSDPSIETSFVSEMSNLLDKLEVAVDNSTKVADHLCKII